MKSITSSGPMELLAADFIGPMPETHEGHKYILVLTDHFSKFSIFIPVKNTRSTTLVQILNKIFCTFGAPVRFLSDNGPQFVSKRLSLYLADWGILHTLITPYHAQANFVERVNRNIKGMMSCFHSKDHTHWGDYVPEFQFALNSVTHDSTGYSPAKLFLGRVLDGPGDRAILTIPRDFSDPKMEQTARENMEKMAARNKKAYDTARENATFEINSKVLVKSHYLSKASKKFTAKLAPRWKGPFKVVERLSPLNYKLVTVDETGINDEEGFVAHVEQMKLYNA